MRFEKYLIVISLAVLILFLIVQYTLYESLKDQTINNINNQQMIYARQAASGIEDHFDHTIRTLNFLAHYSDVINVTGSGRQTLENYEKLFSDEIKGVTRVDASGKIIYTYPDTGAVGRDISYQKHITEIMKTHKPVVSDVFNAVQGFRTIAVHVPVFKGNTYDGTLAFLLSFDHIAQRYIKNIKVQQSGYAWVVSANGIEISSPYPDHIGQNVFELYKGFPDMISMIDSMLQQKQGVTTYHYNRLRGKSNENVLKHAVYLPIPLENSFWSIVVATPEDEVIAALSGIRNKLLYTTLFLLLILFISLYIIIRYKIIIVEQRKRESISAALLESEQKYKELIEKMLDGVYKSTHEGKFLQVNDALVKMLGYNSKEELYNIDIKSQLYFHESDRESAALEEKLEEMAIFRLRKKDGSELWVEDHGRHVLDEKGNVLYHEGVMRDVTERLRIERELIDAKEKAEEMNRLKTNFLSNMSHELRTPLIGILGYTDIMLQEINDEEHLNMMKIINSSGNRLLRTLNQVLNLSKVESGNSDISLIDCDVKEIIITIQNLFSAVARDKELQMELNLPDESLFLKADKNLLTSILENLVHNAIKYTPKGKISISARQLNNNVVIEVADTGIGIADEDKDVIFEEFRQASEGFSRKFEGTGLGLTVVKKYTDIMGGTITLNSEPGVGTTFILKFPSGSPTD
jgi:PAS domain S-box-containing protein